MMNARDRMIEAAVETVRAVGYAGATSRAIAKTGGFNQALVYYHFGSVDGLLLAALDDIGEKRLARYRTIVDGAETLEELIDAFAQIYRLDRRSGHVTFVSQLIAGSATHPDLAREVLARMEPWIDFARDALEQALVSTPFAELAPVDELAYALVTYYLGLNLLTHLDPRRARADALFASLRELAPLVAALDD
jgi:AcrR family transcriptional regulator